MLSHQLSLNFGPLLEDQLYSFPNNLIIFLTEACNCSQLILPSLAQFQFLKRGPNVVGLWSRKEQQMLAYKENAEVTQAASLEDIDRQSDVFSTWT